MKKKYHNLTRLNAKGQEGYWLCVDCNKRGSLDEIGVYCQMIHWGNMISSDKISCSDPECPCREDQRMNEVEKISNFCIIHEFFYIFSNICPKCTQEIKDQIVRSNN